MKQPWTGRAYALILAAMWWSVAIGCATTDNQRESDIPWNQPQPWEGSPYIPGMDRY